MDGKSHAVGAGTPWLSEWVTTSGIVSKEIYSYDGIPSHYSWHAWNIVGWKTIEGIPYLKAEMHQGISFGDGGFIWFPREIVNKLFDEWGTIILKQMKAIPTETKLVKYTIIELILAYINQMIRLKDYPNAFSNLVSLLKLLGK